MTCLPKPVQVGALVVLLAGCAEDRGFASDIAAHLDLLRLKDQLACHKQALQTYPSDLASLSSAESIAKCPLPEELATSLNYSSQGSWLSHRWEYKPRRRTAEGRFEFYTLEVTDLRRASRYRSFWLDATGVVRSSNGSRPADRDDPAESLQRLEDLR